MARRTFVLTVTGLLWAVVAHAQGHGYTPADIENGGLFYQANCTACHGPDGDGVPSINLGSGKFRRGTTDDEIVKIILGGIPGTAMPPSSFSEGQAGTIVAYLRSLASRRRPACSRAMRRAARRCSRARGSVRTATASLAWARGRPVAQRDRAGRAARSSCSDRSSTRAPTSDPIIGPVRVVTRDGATITGRLLNQDTFTVQLLDTSGRLRLLDKSTVREFTILKESPMPSYKDKLNAQEIADLVTYLTTLKGRR